MGLILAAGASLSSVLGDQWKDYFYCSEMPANVLVRKGEHHTGKSGLLNRGGSENIITNGSTVVVNEGQCMIIVDQGAIVDICAEPGAYTYDTSSEPSIFTSGLGKGIKESFKKFAARVAYGGVTAHDQRVYYFNTKNIIGNKYGTASPVPFRVVDRNIGLDLDISIRCFGEYVYKMTDPILFYKNVCGNVDRDYTRDKIEDQLRSELLTALQPAFARISDQGIRYSSLPGHTRELSEALNTELSSTWGQVYGIEIVTCGVSSVKASEEDEQAIKNLQLGLAAGGNAAIAAGMTVQANAQAMKDAAKNANGAMMASLCSRPRPSSRQQPRCSLPARLLPDGPALPADTREIQGSSAATAVRRNRLSPKSGPALPADRPEIRANSALPAVRQNLLRAPNGPALPADRPAIQASSAQDAESPDPEPGPFIDLT